MAQTLEIRTKKDTVQLVLDGHEIHDVLSYQLEESPNQLPVLTVRVAITGGVAAFQSTPPTREATVERDLRPVAGGHKISIPAPREGATVERDGHKDPPRADRHDTQGLLKEYMAHMREVMHHQECAYFVLLDLLDELIHDR